MKICVVSSSVLAVGQGGLAGYGGLEQIAWLQAKGLAELGHEVSLVAPDGSSCPDVTVIHTGPAGQWDERRSYERYWKHLLSVDCVVDNSWSKWSYILKAEGRLKVPVLGVIHAPVDTTMRSLPPVEFPCFVCISHDQASHFEALHSREAKVVHNGCDPSYYNYLGTPRTDRYLFLARFSRIKGASIAQDVCREAGVGLDLVGDTSITGEPDYLQECLRKADGNLIRLVGPATRSECVHWFSQARGFLHLNKYYKEPFGLAPVEAQLCGLGVIAWNYGAMRETVKHGETGFLVRSEKEVVELLKSNALDSLDRNKCREWASQFSVDNMVKNYLSLCERAVQGDLW